jgi:hypothetical protein
MMPEKIRIRGYRDPRRSARLAAGAAVLQLALAHG